MNDINEITIMPTNPFATKGRLNDTAMLFEVLAKIFNRLDSGKYAVYGKYIYTYFDGYAPRFPDEIYFYSNNKEYKLERLYFGSRDKDFTLFRVDKELFNEVEEREANENWEEMVLNVIEKYKSMIPTQYHNTLGGIDESTSEV